ncbi:hypothetical protein DL93DRAFT_1796909 [Clavulina sp. PMI_390]|nr:hypothetical protein DL93DRAFT_1796909 [Clavulina sp. PMI_390]
MQVMLGRGAACLQCRNLKVKCDALKPSCSRCTRFRKECIYSSGVAQRRRSAVALRVEARLLELELMTHKLNVPSSHNLSLASNRLLEKIGRLGKPQTMQSLTIAAPNSQPVIIDHNDYDTDRQNGGVVIDNSDPSGASKTVEQQLHRMI